jgi:DNA modification methylase/methylase of polypeptide subunit release factors
MQILLQSSNKSRQALSLATAVTMTNPNETQFTTNDLKLRLAMLPTDMKHDFSDSLSELSRFPREDLKRIIKEVGESSAPLADILSDARVAEEPVERLKPKGVILTPYWLASRIARNASKHWARLHRTGKKPLLIGDLSCGTGVFLLAAENCFGRSAKIMGQDIDAKSLKYAKLLRYINKSDWEITQGDSLLTSGHVDQTLFDLEREKGPKFDVLLGNPPYIRSQLLDKKYTNVLSDHYPSLSYGNFDISVAFLEHAIRNLNEGGLASYIVSSKFMSSKYGMAIRRLLEKEVRIINIEDFQDSQLFKDYTTYTCILTFTKLSKAKRFTITRFPGGVGKYADPGIGETSSISSDFLSAETWDFAAGHIHEVLRKLRNPQNPFATEVIGPIYQGIRTGANSVFVLNRTNASRVEAELLRPFVGGEEIDQFRCEPSKLFVLYPYFENNMGELQLLPEYELQSMYPKTWKYLLENKGQLQERALEQNGAWYGFSRSQNLNLCNVRKILVREIMPRAIFAPDLIGKVIFSSGYAFDASRLSDDDLLLWTSVLCTPTMEFLLRSNSTQLHSGWFRLLKHYLNKTRLPVLSQSQKQTAKKIAKKLSKEPDAQKLVAQLDDIVSQAFCLNDKHRQIVTDYLNDFHKRSCPKMHDEAKKALYCSTHSESESHRSILFEPVTLSRYDKLHRDRIDLKNYVTFVPNKQRPIHRWYSYTQGFSDFLVEYLLSELKLTSSDTVLDPFGGCGTTSLTCRRVGIPSVSVDISPFISWVSDVKTRAWEVGKVESFLSDFKSDLRTIKNESFDTPSIFKDFFSRAFSKDILNQLQAVIKKVRDGGFKKELADFILFGLVSVMEGVSQIRKHGSHYRYMLDNDNIGLQKLNIRVVEPDTSIAPILINRLEEMIADIKAYELKRPLAKHRILVGDAKKLPLMDKSISAVITSPPYLNRNNYIAQQKAELALLGFIKSPEEYKELVRSTFRSHVESNLDSVPKTSFPDVEKILKSLKITDNNNPKIPHMIAGYFEDMKSVLLELRRVVKPGGHVVFVVGNTRWGGVVVPVDHLLAQIAEENGFRPEKILVTRFKGNSPQQMAKYGKIPVRESIVIFSRR